MTEKEQQKLPSVGRSHLDVPWDMLELNAAHRPFEWAVTTEDHNTIIVKWVSHPIAHRIVDDHNLGLALDRGVDYDDD